MFINKNDFVIICFCALRCARIVFCAVRRLTASRLFIGSIACCVCRVHYFHFSPRCDSQTAVTFIYKKARESDSSLIPLLRLSHCLPPRISNAEAHANVYIKSQEAFCASR